ncbi:MAG: hypothetical protein ABJQ38_16770, partial [Flavobacteriaceae bacterium]
RVRCILLRIASDAVLHVDGSVEVYLMHFLVWGVRRLTLRKLSLLYEALVEMVQAHMVVSFRTGFW